MLFSLILTNLNLDLSPEALEQEKEGRKGIFILFYFIIFLICKVFNVVFVSRLKLLF